MAEIGKQKGIHGFAMLNAYRDFLRHTNVGTATLSFETETPLSYFGFVDFSNRDYWTEQFFRYRMGESPFHASVEYVGASGLPAHVARFGVLWNLHQTKGLRDVLSKAGVYAFGIYAHLLEVDSQFSISRGLENFRRGGQLEPFIAGAIPGTGGRLFYDGWLDLDLDKPKGEDFIVRPVSDFLFGWNLAGNPTTTGALRLVAEGRYNEYFRRLQKEVPTLKKNHELNPWGVEWGLSYLLLFN